LGRHLRPDPLDGVDLHHDAPFEVVAGVEVELLVRGTGETKAACMAATPVGVDRPAERDPGLRGYSVDHPLGSDLEELEAPELAVAGAPGGRLLLEERLLRRIAL